MIEFVKQYPAIVEPNGDNGFGVYFPYMPGLGTVGDDYEEALTMAKEALSLHISGMIEDGEGVPVFDIKAVAKEAKEAGSMVALIEPDFMLLKKLVKGKATRVNITINSVLLEMADKRAKELHTNRSKLIESGLEMILGEGLTPSIEISR